MSSTTSLRPLNPRAQAVQPQRRAGERRYHSVLEEADKLLGEEGLTGFSIPVLAERLGYTRRSIYKFFPSPYAILNELTKTYLDRLEAYLVNHAELQSKDLHWEEVVTRLNTEAAKFHNANPVSRLLILGGAVTDESFRATEYSIKKLGGILNDLLNERGIQVPTEPDVASLAVDIATSVFRVSNLYHGYIDDQYGRESGRAMVAYLNLYVTPS